MPTYASKTTVSAEKTRGEIELLLTKHGATAFMYGTSDGRAIIQFEMTDRRYRLTLRLPTAQEHRTPHTGYLSKAAYDQALRQIWRALLLVIKAKLVAVEQGIMTLEKEFMAYLVLPNNTTMADHLAPQIAEMLTTGALPALLPEPHKENYS